MAVFFSFFVISCMIPQQRFPIQWFRFPISFLLWKELLMKVQLDESSRLLYQALTVVLSGNNSVNLQPQGYQEGSASLLSNLAFVAILKIQHTVLMVEVILRTLRIRPTTLWVSKLRIKRDEVGSNYVAQGKCSHYLHFKQCSKHSFKYYANKVASLFNSPQ